MLRLIRLLIAFVVLAVIVIFAIANRDPVQVSFAPLPAVMELPLYGVFLLGLVFGVLIGGFSVWFSYLKKAREARRLRNKVWALENQLNLIRQQEEKAQAERQAAGRAVAVPRAAA
ncbi:MAG TPA: LapA family protein [Geminicoccaceae bacterium]